MKEFIYTDNKQLRNELKELINTSNYKNTKIAEKMGISRQNYNNIINVKKNINCDDIKNILDVIDYDLIITFAPKKDKKTSQTNNNDDNYNGYDLNKSINIDKYIIEDLENYKNYFTNYINAEIDKKLDNLITTTFIKNVDKLHNDSNIQLTEEEAKEILNKFKEKNNIIIKEYKKQKNK